MDGVTVCKTSEVPAPAFEISKREVTAYVSIFGNLDSVGDIVEPGAFDFSRVAKGLVPVKHNHERIVGKTVDASQDATGLLTVQKYGADPESDRIFGMVRDGIIPTFSFKARIPKGGQNRKKNADGQSVNYLTKMILLEAGPADPDLAVNDRTYTVSTKAMSDLASIVDVIDGLRFGGGDLGDEEREALRRFVAALPVVGKCLTSFIQEPLPETPTPDMGVELGKALQLSDAIEDWQLGRLLARVQQINQRRNGTAN